MAMEVLVVAVVAAAFVARDLRFEVLSLMLLSIAHRFAHSLCICELYSDLI